MRNKTPISKIENFLLELEKLANETGDDYIISDAKAWIENICLEEDICERCYTQVTEALYDDRFERHCDCKSSPKIVRYA